MKYRATARRTGRRRGAGPGGSGRRRPHARANPTEWSVSPAACSCGDPKHHEGFDLIATDHGASRVYRRYRTAAAARQALRRMTGASSAAWRCTGRGAGSTSRCRRTFRSRTSAIRHFEKTGHDVEGPNPTRSNPTDIGRILDLLAASVARELRGEDPTWEWFHSMTNEDRLAFDLMLVRTGDLLAWQAGTAESRWRAKVHRMAELERHRRAGTIPQNPATGAGVCPKGHALHWAGDGKRRWCQVCGIYYPAPANPRRGSSRRSSGRSTETVRHNPPRGRAVLIYPEGRVVGTWFGTHRNGGHYKHRFTHRSAAIYGNPDGSITLRPHKGRLWAMFR